jgi:hypothetical protein
LKILRCLTVSKNLPVMLGKFSAAYFAIDLHFFSSCEEVKELWLGGHERSLTRDTY